MNNKHEEFRPLFSLPRRAAPFWVVLILLMSFFVFFTTVGAQIESQSASHRGFSAVLECPDSIEQRPPSRVVLQHIDGVFHKWEEYDLGDKGAFCIVLRRPEQRRLSTGEARTLLENSARWLEQTPAGGVQEVLDPDDPRLLAPPATPKLPEDFRSRGVPASSEPAGPLPAVYPSREDRSKVSTERIPLPRLENVIGADTRSRVAATEYHPWNTVGYIYNTYASGKAYRGTGFIVSPYAVLTNGHLVYDSDEGAYAEKIDFSPGQRQRVEGDEVIRPYGTRTAFRWETDSRYIDVLTEDPNAQIDHDYAVLFFDTSFSGLSIGTYMPLVFDIAASGDINLAGYPAAVQGEANSRSMWLSSGNIQENTDRILFHDADTSGGNSGSPIWQYFRETDQRRVIAVHAFGTPGFNGGPRLVAQNRALIQSWLEWAPVVSSGNGGGRSCFIATAAYGSYLDPHVQILRNFRDRYLSGHRVGDQLVWLYYRTSPPVARKIAASEGLRVLTRWCLMPVVGIAYLAVRFGMALALLMLSAVVLMPVFMVWLYKKFAGMHDQPGRGADRLNIVMKKHQAHSL